MFQVRWCWHVKLIFQKRPWTVVSQKAIFSYEYQQVNCLDKRWSKSSAPSLEPLRFGMVPFKIWKLSKIVFFLWFGGTHRILCLYRNLFKIDMSDVWYCWCGTFGLPCIIVQYLDGNILAYGVRFWRFLVFKLSTPPVDLKLSLLNIPNFSFDLKNNIPESWVYWIHLYWSIIKSVLLHPFSRPPSVRIANGHC